MNPTDIVGVLDRFLLQGLATGVFLAVQNHQVERTETTSKVRPHKRLGMITNGGITPSEYIAILDEDTYSAVFEDGSIIYLECSFDGQTLSGHRYFYIPCPFSSKLVLDRPNDFYLADWLRDSIELEGADVFNSRGALRFDCVRGLAEDAQDSHPVSHLTFASGDCRLPLRGPLQVSAFLNLVFDNFFRLYRPLWLQFAPYMSLDETEVTIRPDEAGLHHLNWDS